MNYIKILGASGSKSKNSGTTSFQISKEIIIDAGNIINTLGDQTQFINHIFLTHSHSDHITDLPFIIESFFDIRTKSLVIYASKETISSLKRHMFNNEIWPDFSKINLLNSDQKALVFKELEENETIDIDNYSIKTIHANHIPGSYGYIVMKNNHYGYLISGDTYKNDLLWDIINNNPTIKSLIIECSFPSHMEKLASESKHLTPNILANQLKQLKRSDVQIFLYHLKPLFYNQILNEIQKFNIFRNGGKVLIEGDVIHIDTGEIESDMITQYKFERMMEINQELSSQLDKNKLLEMILTLSRELTHCEAGTLYIVNKKNKELDFKVIQNYPLNIYMGGTKNEIIWDSLPLYLTNGNENLNMVAAVCAIKNEIINILDIYGNKDYDFTGTKKFDKNTGYHSKSMLVIPLTNHEQEVIGVLQLINKTKISGTITEFTKPDEKLIRALASQAAMAVTNTQLINSLDDFINSFVSTIAHAIDAKSHHTRNHIGKVAKLSTLIAKAIHEDLTIYKDVKYTKDDFKQIELVAWMHDVVKISMPETIIDKATKLQTILDRIELINIRMELIKRDLEIEYLKKNISKKEFEEKINTISNDFEFIKETNKGSEFMDDQKVNRIEQIANYKYKINNQIKSLLTKDEVHNLSIRKGTLTNKEKEIMNSHAKLSYEMLCTLPFPKKYKDVLNIAANHHEKLNGKGYPRGLTEKELSLEDRIMILSDIFEALTSNDRPYKEAKKLSEVFRILSFMAKENEIDTQLLKFFHDNEVLKTYMNEELFPEQIDKKDLKFL